MTAKFALAIGAVGVGALLTSAAARPAYGVGLDYSATLGGRTLPFGGSLSGQAGYNILLWGKREHPTDFLYGYIRPAARLATSAIVNRGDVSLDIFPVSIFGVTVGASETSRLVSTSGMNCVANECTGMIYRNYIEPELTLGYGTVFLAVTVKLEFTGVYVNQSFVDEHDDLVGAPGSDRLVANDIWLGKIVTPQYAVGAHFGTVRMIAAGGSSDQEDIFAQAARGRWSLVLGVGAYESTYYNRGVTAYGQIKWTGIPSLALF